MDDRKGTWEDGDLDAIIIVYEGKVVTKEELEAILKEERKDD